MSITIRNLKKTLNGTDIFCNFDACFEEGKITAIVGPNGSGKSTLLNILSGIIPQDAGEFFIEGFQPFQFSYIFQNYRESLLPWRTNAENIALPLEIQKKSEHEIQQRVKELQELFGSPLNLQGYPYELSGGQQQVLAFFRALLPQPRLFFIDEPFSALDYENNLRMREVLQKYYFAFKPTIVLVTHNIEEAVHLAHTVVVFSQKPTRVYDTIDNPLPFPRTIATLKSHSFDSVKDRVLSSFQNVVRV